MKTIQRSLLITLIPLVTPLTAMAETGKQSERTDSAYGKKSNEPAWRASQVIGIDVKNAASETIGEVEDLVLNMKNGEVLAVVISSGGFLGIGDSLSAVPVAVLRYDDKAKAFKTKLTKEQLGKAPQFKSDAWPDYSEASSMEALRSFRNSIGGDVTAPDNTAQNEKKRNKHAGTPAGQGNRAQDIRITKAIRSDIMDTDLSFNAKNIKVVTRNEKVTLNGVVKSDAEHQAILKIARNHANTDRITDNLKVNK